MYKITVMADPDPADPRSATQKVGVHMEGDPAKWGFPITMEEYLSEGEAYKEFDEGYCHCKVYRYPGGHSKTISVTPTPSASLAGVAFSHRKYWSGKNADADALSAIEDLVDKFSYYLGGAIYGYAVRSSGGLLLASEWGFYSEEKARQAGEHHAFSKRRAGWNPSILPKDTTQLYLLSINGEYELAYWNDESRYWDNPYGPSLLNSEIDGWMPLPGHP